MEHTEALILTALFSLTCLLAHSTITGVYNRRQISIKKCIGQQRTIVRPRLKHPPRKLILSVSLPPPLFQTRVRTVLFHSLLFVFVILSVSSAQDLNPAQDTGTVSIQPYPKPASNLSFRDNPNDGGGSIVISWQISTDDTIGSPVVGYEIYRSTDRVGEFVKISDAAKGNSSLTDNATQDGIDYFYRVDTKAIDPLTSELMLTPSQIIGPARSVPQWFNRDRTFALVMILLVGGAIIFYIQQAKRGKSLYVRKIGGIDAVDEAIGRATEMGKKVFFVPGIQDMNDVQTIAGIAILGRVAAVAAEYETWLEVPVSKSIVMVTARETMKEAYTRVGRPDSFQESQVYFITDEQFAYAAAVDGRIVRERPATIFYMGAFFAESLILSETGNAAGAIQIAGTAEPTQLPFFVAACDYTLLGEELFAASAYLSREPRQLGSLKGQDFGKAIFLIAIIIGIILTTFQFYDLASLFRTE